MKLQDSFELVKRIIVGPSMNPMISSQDYEHFLRSSKTFIEEHLALLRKEEILKEGEIESAEEEVVEYDLNK